VTATEPETVTGEVVDPDEPEASQEVVLREAAPAVVARGEIGVTDLMEQHAKIQQALSEAMREDVHYGTIPGTQKPTLLKPGAQKLCVLFRLAPSFQTERIFHEDGHLTVVSNCVLTHIPTGYVIAGGDGLCTTRETRYAYRQGQRVCPECGEPQVRKGKARGSNPANWYCWRKEGGCGQTWPLDSEQGQLFEKMDTGRTDNPDLPDLYNTVLKMANKRALVDAVINGTAASDVFTQDMEDSPRTPGEASNTSADRTDGTTSQRAAAAEPVESTPPWDPPKDWKILLERLAECFGGGEYGVDTARAWVSQALNETAGVISVTDLDEKGKRKAWSDLQIVLRELEDYYEGDRAFRTGMRELAASAFHKAFGVALFGPRWRMDPSEDTLPTHEAYLADEAAEAAMMAMDDDLPEFGAPPA
jgi:hypothetical protein